MAGRSPRKKEDLKRLNLSLPKQYFQALEQQAKDRGVQPQELAKVWLYDIVTKYKPTSLPSNESVESSSKTP